MSRLSQALRRVFAWLTMPVFADPLPDAMRVRDWADLPPHHPLCDSAPR